MCHHDRKIWKGFAKMYISKLFEHLQIYTFHIFNKEKKKLVCSYRFKF